MLKQAPTRLTDGRSITAAVYEQLRSDMLSCRLRPGAKLNVSDLASQLAVSPGAVREALSRLTSEGLAVSEAQRGFHVAAVSEADLVDLTRVRIEIEGLALRESIASGDVEWETRVVAAYHRLTKTPLREPSDPARVADAWAPAHAEFHLQLVSACTSPRLIQLRTALYEQGERYRQFSLPVADHERDVDGEHRRLMEAVIGRDADRACISLAEHLSETMRILLAADNDNRLSASDDEATRAT